MLIRPLILARAAVLGLALVAVSPAARSAPLTVTDLSGSWTFTPQGAAATTIQVPGGGWYKQGFTNIIQADYQRGIVIPNSGQPQVTLLELGAANYESEAYLNNIAVGTNLTSFTPSVFDLTPFVTPGQAYTLRVHVMGRNAFMTNGQSTMPNAAGWSPNTPQGIFRSAQLAVYPQTRIADVFVRPSVTNSNLYYDVWLANESAAPANLVLAGQLTSWNGTNWAYPAIANQAVSVPAGATNKITIGPVPWNLGSGSFWWPNVPYQTGYTAMLHNLNLTLTAGATTVDTNTVRFGFRELTQHSDGTNTDYFLNGVRVNFRGDSLQGADYDSIVQGGGPGDAYDTLPGFLAGTNGWPEAVADYEQLNYNFVRLHQEPVSPYMLDVCDEAGLMVMEETAIRGSNNDQNFILGFQNMVNHLEALYGRDRNHPCIVRESLSNEPGSDNTDSTQFELSLYSAAMAVDGTRPVSIDGTFYNTISFTNFSTYGHYGNGVGNYTETVWARTDQPYGQGEFVWNVDNTRQGFVWFATGTHAMRAQGASDVRPYTLLSAWAGFVPGVRTTDMILEQGGHPFYGADNLAVPWTNAQITRAQAGFNPVLVADYDYWAANKLSDANGDWPANIPAVAPDTWVTRNLEFYNDTFSGSNVDVFWELHEVSPTGLLLASGQLNPVIAPGYLGAGTISYAIPQSLDGTVDYLVLYAQKAGVELFRESAEQFTVADELPLTGQAFGASPAYAAGSEFNKATDGNITTFYDYAQPNGGYTGIDLGAGNAAVINSIVFTPRNGFESRMIGGVFQGSNDGTNYTTLFTVTALPSPYTRVPVSNPTAYRYLQYVGPSGSYCNIAEMAFYTAPTGLARLRGTAFGASPPYETGREFDKADDENVTTFYDYANANGGYTGIDLGAGHAAIVSLIVFSPRVGYESRMLGGVFQGSNDGTNYTTLFTVATTPTSKTRAAVHDPSAYRFLQYVGPSGSYGNIAEMAFYTATNAGASNGPGMLAAAWSAGNTVSLQWTNTAADLYYTADLQPPVAWALVPPPYALANGSAQATLPAPTNTSLFFRLGQ